MSVGSVVSEARPIRVHWTEEGYEARAGVVLAFAETAWDVQVDALGFAPPVLPDAADGPELDIYLDDLGEFEAYTVQTDWEDAFLGDGRMSTSAWIVFDQDLPEEWLGPYPVHEFNHVLQIATDFTESRPTLWEATATAAQEWTLGEGSLWDDDVADFQQTPWISTLTGGGESEGASPFFEYGAALWVKHLEEVVGLGPQAGAILWEAAAQEGLDPEPDVVDAFAELAGDGDLAVALDELAITRILTGERHRDGGLVDAAAWSDDRTVRASLWNRGDQGTTYNHVEITGQWFRRYLRESTVAEVEISVEGEVSAILAVVGRDGVTTSKDRVSVAPGEELFIAVSRLPPEGWDGDDEQIPGGFSVSLGVDSGIDLDLDSIELDPPTACSGCEGACGGACSGSPTSFLPLGLLLGPWASRRQRSSRARIR